MGCEELIGALRRSADEKVRLIWKEAEDEAGKIREEASRKISELREDYVKTQSSAAGTEAEKILSAAADKARMTGLSSQKILSDRVFLLALSCLPLLRNEGYGDVFSDIARELPRFPWQRVRVNPDDRHLAKEYFPGAEILADENIVGGVDAMVEAGKIRVINTFEKRLERAWVDILPGLIKDIHKEVSNEGSPSES
jgi:vacuolar-type H+-ATPase subunit E/Vma4